MKTSARSAPAPVALSRRQSLSGSPEDKTCIGMIPLSIAIGQHQPAALYDALAPTEARRILRQRRFHYTPKHGAWLNMAEIEISIPSRQCLKQRMASIETLADIVTRWQERRNAQQATIDWSFTYRGHVRS